jgi:hypothetical protein
MGRPVGGIISRLAGGIICWVPPCCIISSPAGGIIGSCSACAADNPTTAAIALKIRLNSGILFPLVDWLR